jgi:hypothetical protein
MRSVATITANQVTKAYLRSADGFGTRVRFLFGLADPCDDVASPFGVSPFDKA